SASYGSFSFAGWVVCESDSRSKIRELPFVWPIDPLTNGNDRILGKVEDAEMIVNFAGNAVVFPTQTKVPGPPAAHFEVVSKKAINPVHAERSVDGSRGRYGRGGRAGEKGGKSGKGDQPPRASVEVFVPKPPQLAAELHRMPSMDPRQSIRELVRSV